MKVDPTTLDSVRWVFGNGVSNTQKKQQTQIFKIPGSFIDTLKVYKGGSKLPIIETEKINIGLTPSPTVQNNDTLTEYNVALRALLKDYSSPFPYTYVWSKDKVEFHTDAAVPAGTVEPWFVKDFGAMGSYTLHLTITDGLGCNFKDSVTIDAWNKIEAPNVFTPNDDGKNDEFIVSSNGTQTLSLKVYTRSGVLIYETEAKRIRWDGRLPSGDKVSTGIYYYVIDSKDGNKVKKTGFVYVYR